MRCQTFDAPLGAKPVMTLLGSVQTTTLVVVMIMSKRTYTHIQELLPTIEAMVTEGMTQREIAEYFGFKDKTVVKFALLRARKKGTTLPKFRERKPAKTLQEYKYENKRLKMENELLRDFLSLTERM